MRILIVGVGAVGGYFGGRLAADGNEVVFAARGANAAALREKGLTVKSPFGDLFVESPQLFDDLEDKGLFDVVLLCTKLTDLPAALDRVKGCLAHDCAVVPLQNGLISEAMVAKALGEQFAVGGIAYIAAGLEAPGLVKHEGGFAKLAFGELDGSRSWRLDALAASCEAAGIDHDYSDNIRQAIWIKFIGLSAFSAVTSYYRSAIGAIMETEEQREFYAALLGESVAAARAAGIDLPENYADKVFEGTFKYPKTMKSSMLQDLERGKALELDYLSGAVAAHGQRFGFATPAHDKVTAALETHKSGQ